ncbi:MAG TPA: ABC transporter ATP-binding protein [Streptosporangiaceae bacterium]|nr:ABC transporter ATP-binding protein [Streptosporangiaceae bacterium]
MSGVAMSGIEMSGAPGAGPGWWGTDAVSVRYGRRVALDQVSFRARPGQVSAVVGGDGAGRSTLLRCLGGALAPSSGVVQRPRQRDIGYLPASSGTYPDLTVAENLAFRAAAYQIPAAAAAERSAAFLARAGLTGARDRLAGQLSGGMRQKLGVIAAMLARPALLVLDEPTTGVDPVSRADLWSLIARAAAEGAAVVLATSYLDEAERATHVLVLDAGRQIAVGTPGQIVAAMPGRLRVSAGRPPAADRPRAWRRAGRWRVWDPDGQAASPSPGGEPIQPDLQDAVTVAILGRELAGPAGTGAGPGAGTATGPGAGAAAGTGAGAGER